MFIMLNICKSNSILRCFLRYFWFRKTREIYFSDGETVETVAGFIFWDSKITADGDCSHEIKTLTPWKESYAQPRQSCPDLQCVFWLSEL